MSYKINLLPQDYKPEYFIPIQYHPAVTQRGADGFYSLHTLANKKIVPKKLTLLLPDLLSGSHLIARNLESFLKSGVKIGRAHV